jgi:2-polyprenyl-3-methyl-5-hydroxy-6-metoxy-1,4-benzoquinol methylase
LLQSLNTAFDGWVVGVEPGDAYRAYAELQGIEMHPSIEALIERKSPKFDLVSMMHVLEHLPDPVATLQQIRENLLDPEGVLLIEVPNFYVHDSYELAHLTCFTPNTLEQTLNQAGYRVHALLKHGEPRSSILKLYITVLARPLLSDQKVPSITKENWIGIKRKTGIVFRRMVQKLAPNLAWYPLPGEEEL